ncbi:hypothetical protein RQP46_001202 [Phenoliferia psychrophenolica]
MTTPAPPNTRYSVNVLSTSTVDSSPSLVVIYDAKRYLFNTPEAISRVCVQGKTGMRKIHNVFLSQLDNSAGLPGFLLSTVEAGNNQVEVVGPEGTEHLVASYRFFTRREQLSLKVTSPPPPSSTPSLSLPAPIHSDPNLLVYAFPLARTAPSPPAPTSPSASLKRKRSSTSPSPPPRPKSPPPPSVDLLVEEPLEATPAAPTFDPSAPGFTPSRLRGTDATTWRRMVINDMFRGTKFTSSSTTSSSTPTPTITPLDFASRVLATRNSPSPSYLQQSLPLPSPSPLGPISLSYLAVGPSLRGRFLPEAFLVLNLSSPALLPSLLSTITPSVLSQIKSAQLQTVFYLLGPGVLHDPLLSTFISSLPSTLQHRFSSPDLPSTNLVTFGPAALLSLRLSFLSPTVFRLPTYSFLPLLPSPPTPSLFPSSFPQETSHLLRPTDRFERGTTPLPLPYATTYRSFDFPVPSPEAELQASLLKSSHATPATLARASEIWSSYRPAADLIRDQVEQESLGRPKATFPGAGLRVTPLGTGSAIPSKYRNDHHAGLATILKERNSLSPPPTTPLTIICPPGARMYLSEQQALFNLGLDPSTRTGPPVHFVDTFAVEAGKTLSESDKRREVMNDLYASLGLTSVVAVPVLHRCRCWGVVLEHASGWKVVFSGDTMPCEALVVAGRGATLVIHEATIEDSLPDVARAKGHSTFGQAIDIARRMEAQHCLLTHFSARYPKLPPLEHSEDSTSNDPVVAMAFDLMTLRLDEFWKMERFRPTMDLLFGDDEEGDEGSVEGDGPASVVGGEAEKEVAGGKGKKGKKEKKAAAEVV